MEALREITEWTGVEYRSPNHDYLLDGDKIIAYRPWGTAEIRVLRSGIKIDRRGRKFVKLDPNPFYSVDAEAHTCTCPGFQFRGACKHLASHG